MAALVDAAPSGSRRKHRLLFSQQEQSQQVSTTAASLQVSVWRLEGSQTLAVAALPPCGGLSGSGFAGAPGSPCTGRGGGACLCLASLQGAAAAPVSLSSPAFCKGGTGAVLLGVQAHVGGDLWADHAAGQALAPHSADRYPGRGRQGGREASAGREGSLPVA